MCSSDLAWQHDARMQANGTITIFDDEASPAEAKQSRAIRIRLDLATHTATLAQSDSDGTLAISQGNVQVLDNGDLLVGWGSVPRITEFSPSGAVVFDATFSKGDDSYRAFRFTWTGAPVTKPSIAVARGGGSTATVWASWNGATQVVAWRVLAGLNGDRLSVLDGPVPRKGFETTIAAHTDAPYIAVQALDARGRILGTSAAVPRGGDAIG